MWTPWTVWSSLALSSVACLGALWSLFKARRSQQTPASARLNDVEERLTAVEGAMRALDTEWTSQYDKMRKMNARLRARWDHESALAAIPEPPNPDGSNSSALPAPVSTKHLRNQILSTWLTKRSK